MFWKKTTPQSKPKRLINGEWRTDRRVVLLLVMRHQYRHLAAKTVWNGQEIIINFAECGIIRIHRDHIYWTWLSVLDEEHFDRFGEIWRPFDYTEERIFEIDALETWVRTKSRLRSRFESRGVSIESFSLDELRLYGAGMVQGWNEAQKFHETEGVK